jgi:hypothetical protein
MRGAGQQQGTAQRNAAQHCTGQQQGAAKRGFGNPKGSALEAPCIETPASIKVPFALQRAFVLSCLVQGHCALGRNEQA